MKLLSTIALCLVFNAEINQGWQGWVNSTWDLNTFHMGQWCETDTVPGLMPFIEPQLDEAGFFIRPE